MKTPTQCPKCQSENIYEDGSLWICPECSHEWNIHESVGETKSEDTQDARIKDAHGNVLFDGDTVVVIKDLKVKGSSSVVKGGTKVKNIRLVDGDDGHNIACKIDGFGAMNLKSEFVKKA
ncbi:MAG TPA: zinc ribbon domain-containing protein YjdM [Bdellovibrio sp.]|nr:zinc ribbon domain-containing protein YjdM [Bdellovibrio sp.]